MRVEKKRVERSASRELSIERVEVQRQSRERDRVERQRQSRERRREGDRVERDVERDRVERDVERETE